MILVSGVGFLGEEKKNLGAILGYLNIYMYIVAVFFIFYFFP